jgi:beta-1,4-mannosyl-glycoprotein beta-1,4-N-acetylglucosaminyltransferase
MAIIDCFTFFNELELLEIRLNYLDPIIDKFVLVEANKTHSGMDKPLYYEENKLLFKSFYDKIIHVIVNDMPPVVNNNRWALENYQRNAVLIGLEYLKPQDDDYILIGDLDEIPNKDIVQSQPFGTYDQKCFMYYLNVQSEEHWNGTIGLKYKLIRTNTNFTVPQRIRDQRNYLEPIRNGGWHFGWLGDYDRIYQKIKAFAHTEIDVPQYMEPLRETIRDIKPLWCPNGGPMKVIKIEELGNDYIINNQDKFKELIYG